MYSPKREMQIRYCVQNELWIDVAFSQIFHDLDLSESQTHNKYTMKYLPFFSFE